MTQSSLPKRRTLICQWMRSAWVGGGGFPSIYLWAEGFSGQRGLQAEAQVLAVGSQTWVHPGIEVKGYEEGASRGRLTLKLSLNLSNITSLPPSSEPSGCWPR